MPRAYHDRGVVYTEKGDFDAAIADFTKPSESDQIMPGHTVTAARPTGEKATTTG